MANLPAILFYTGDYMKDPAVRSCSYAARGLWVDMLWLMHESARRGYLQHANGQPISLDQLARMTGGSPDEVLRLLQELENSGVFSRTVEHGTIYNRRMVRDERKRQLCSEAGKRGGGNPKLDRSGGADWSNRPGYIYAMSRDQDAAIKIGGSANPNRRLVQGGKGTIPHAGAQLIRTWAVSRMGAAEAMLHERLSAKREGGEWFWLTPADLDQVAQWLDEAGLTYIGQPNGRNKGDPKVAANQPPNSSSSSPSGERGGDKKHPPSLSPRARARASGGEREGGVSRHTLEVCLRFARARKGIHTPEAFAAKIHASGTHDELIDDFLSGRGQKEDGDVVTRAKARLLGS